MNKKPAAEQSVTIDWSKLIMSIGSCEQKSTRFRHRPIFAFAE
jgi:hypothetical protein